MTMIEMKDEEKGKLKGWHVLLYMLAFFGVMFVVNGIFLFHAITSFPGEDTKKSYLQGLDYNTKLEERAAQRQLGWHVAMGIERDTLIITYRDAENNPAYPAHVKAHLHRSATISEDVIVEMQSVGNGEYRADVSALNRGMWEVVAIADTRHSDAPKFTAEKRICYEPCRAIR